MASETTKVKRLYQIPKQDMKAFSLQYKKDTNKDPYALLRTKKQSGGKLNQESTDGKYTLESLDTNSKAFVTNWLSSRKNVLLNNIKSSANANATLTDAEKELSKQLDGMNKTSISVDKSIANEAQYDPVKNKIQVSPEALEYLDSYTPLNTITHERTHSLRGGPNDMTPQEQSIRYLNIDSKDSYLDKPSEIYARLMAFRNSMKLDPNKIVTEDDLQNWRKSTRLDYPHNLSRYSNTQLLNLFNSIAYNNTSNKDGMRIASKGAKLGLMGMGAMQYQNGTPPKHIGLLKKKK